MLSLEGDHTPKPLIAVPGSNQTQAYFAPDGRWLVYASGESGRSDIYVQPFPPTGVKYQITTTGGGLPIWSHDGKQIFYIEARAGAGAIVSVDVRTQPSFGFGNPIKLPIDKIPLAGFRPYDLTPDGKQFLAVLSGSDAAEKPTPPQLRITLNWFEELKQRVHYPTPQP